MSTSISDFGVVDLGCGRVYKMNLLFPSKMVRRVLPDADEEDCDPCSHEIVPFGYIPVDAISSEMLDPCYGIECDEERDDRIFGDEEDDPVNPNGDPLDILIAAEESNKGYDHGWDAEDYAFFRAMHEPVEVFDVDGQSFAHSGQYCVHARQYSDCGMHYHAHHKVTYGPHGERITKDVRIESHGVHGRKRVRPKRVTIRGARVRADVVCSSRRSPRCVGLVATPRKCE